MKTSLGGGYQHPGIIATIYNMKCLLTNKNYKACKEIGRYDPFTKKKRRQKLLVRVTRSQLRQQPMSNGHCKY